MTAALIIAAGTTPGRDGFEPTQPTGVLSAVQRLILTFRQAGAKEVVLVADSRQNRLEKHVAKLGVTLLAPQAAGGEMLDSVKTGLRYLQDKCERVLITPVDVPLFTAHTVGVLLQTGAQVASPSYEGKAGHPLLLAQSRFAFALDYVGGDGLRGALQAMEVQRIFVPVQDEGTVLNIQRAEGFEELVERHTLRRLRPRIKLQLAKEQTFFGPGTEQLLRLIENTGSVRLACQLMGISYSKGWKMIALMEQQLGYTVVERQQGGAQGGKASLTQAGRVLLERYRAFAQECEAQVQRIFESHFPLGE